MITIKVHKKYILVKMSNKKCKVVSVADLIKPQKSICTYAIVFVTMAQKLILALKRNTQMMKVCGNRSQRILEKIRNMLSWQENKKIFYWYLRHKHRNKLKRIKKMKKRKSLCIKSKPRFFPTKYWRKYTYIIFIKVFITFSYSSPYTLWK